MLALVEAMPKERRKAVRARFAAAEAAIAQAGLAERGGRSDREMSVGYFALRVPCPFLEEESCSIHPDRPLVCREYLVTSPAELCAGPAQDGVTPVPVPKLSLAARRLQDEQDDWFPLAMLMAWSRKRPGGGKRRPGTEWVQRFLKEPADLGPPSASERGRGRGQRALPRLPPGWRNVKTAVLRGAAPPEPKIRGESCPRRALGA